VTEIRARLTPCLCASVTSVIGIWLRSVVMAGDTFSFSQRAARAAYQPISDLLADALADPDLISLAAGFVDDQTLPAEGVADVITPLLADLGDARKALQYGTTQGLPSLRAALFEHLARLDGLSPAELPGSADDVVVTAGSQQLLHLLTDVLVDPGDIVVTGWPSYFVYTGALSAFGAEVRSVDLDDDGIDPARLDDLFSRLSRESKLPRVKIVYTCTYHKNPAGLTLSADRRPQLLAVVKRWSERAGHRILIIEDNAYRELTYGEPPPEVSGPASVTPDFRDPGSQRPARTAAEALYNRALPSIYRHDADHAHVAVLQTFSKPFAPGLKTGYGLLPPDLVEPVILAKGGRDFGSPNLNQHVLDRAVRTGVFAEQVRRLRVAYAAKRDAMLAALEHHLGGFEPEHTHWTRPRGGLYVWLTLPERIDTQRLGPLYNDALQRGVLYVPGVFCFPHDPTRTAPTHHVRLTFGVPTIPQIQDGIARLADAIKAV